MPKQLDLNCIAKLIPFVEKALASHKDDKPDFCDHDWDEWRKRQREAEVALTASLEKLGARIKKNPATGTDITLAGIRSSSTTGLSGACSNWLVNARRKING